MREHLLLDPDAGDMELAEELVARSAGGVDGEQTGDAGAFVRVDGPAGYSEAAVGGGVHVPGLDGDVGATRQAPEDEDAGAIEVAGVTDVESGRRAHAQQHDDGPGGLATGEDHQLTARVGALEVIEEGRLILEDRDAAGGQLHEPGAAELGGGERTGIAEHGMAGNMVERRRAVGAGVHQRAEGVYQDAGVVAQEAPDLERRGRRGQRRGRLHGGDLGLGRRIVEQQGGAEPASALAAGKQRLAVTEDARGEVRDADRVAQLEHGGEREGDVGDDGDRRDDTDPFGELPGVAGGRGRELGGEEITRRVVRRRRDGAEGRPKGVAAGELFTAGVTRNASEGGVQKVVERMAGDDVAQDQPGPERRQRRDRPRREQGAQSIDRDRVGVDRQRGRHAPGALAMVEQRVEGGTGAGGGGDGVPDGLDENVALHDAQDTAAARRLTASQPGERAAAFADGCAPVLARGLDGRIGAAITAERAPWYLTILYGMLLFRRDHELEPLHEDVQARVAAAAAGLGPYDAAGFAQDVEQLVEWKALERLTEAHKLRNYRDNRRDRFRYRLTDDAVALLEWLEARLAAKLAGRVGDSRDRLADVLGHLREVRRVLDDWRSGERGPDQARRALYLIEAVGDALDDVGTELLTFRAEMLGFASRPYDLGSLRTILAWLERYVTVYLRRLEELRGEIATRLDELAVPRRQAALAECHAAVVEERAASPRALRGAAVLAPGDRLVAHGAFFAATGMLAVLCARIDESARAVVVKMQRHLRELERRSARLEDVRAAIRLVAAGAATDPRYARLAGGLVASAHLRMDRGPAWSGQPAAPPLPRRHVRTAPAAATQPLARKRGSLAAVKELTARRQALLGAWLDGVTGSGGRTRLSDLGLRSADAPRRWLDVARARHLGGGRVLEVIGFRMEPAGGEAALGDERCGLAAPDCWIERGK